MSQVIFLLLFPIGLYFYFFQERPNRERYTKVFTDFEASIQNNDTLLDAEKVQLFKDMLLKNNYKIIEATPITVTGETRIFSMSLFAMGLGVFYIGAAIYVLYYYFQKPKRVTFALK